MSYTINKAIIVGRLGRDPEVRFIESGKAICKMSVATSETWGEGAEKQERTEWHTVTAWGRMGEACGQYLHKGSMVYVEGRIQTRKYQDQSGNDRYFTEINARDIVFLSPKGDNGRGQQSQQTQQESHHGGQSHYGPPEARQNLQQPQESPYQRRNQQQEIPYGGGYGQGQDDTEEDSPF